MQELKLAMLGKRLCVRRPRRNNRALAARRGIALVVTLVVVMLITTLLSQFNFTTSLELRSLRTQMETMQARSLARSAFKAVQSSLLQDQSDFLFGYNQLKPVLAVSAVPWEEGLLTALEIEPQDSLFNLNRFAKIQPDSPQDILLHELFQKTFVDVTPVPDETTTFVEPPQPGELSALYAALSDWIDPDDTVYTAIPGAPGAEGAAYFGPRPERAPPNRPLERLTEIRLVRGVAESRIAWEDWRKRFSIHEAKAGESNLYPGLLNVNGATHAQIVSFLETRRLDDATTNELPPEFKDAQIALNKYAGNAEEIANELVPSDAVAPVLAQKLTQSQIKSALGAAQVNAGYSSQVFSTSDEYFRVRIVTAVGDAEAELEAVLHTPRNPSNRTATKADVLEYRLR